MARRPAPVVLRAWGFDGKARHAVREYRPRPAVAQRAVSRPSEPRAGTYSAVDGSSSRWMLPSVRMSRRLRGWLLQCAAALVPPINFTHRADLTALATSTFTLNLHVDVASTNPWAAPHLHKTSTPGCLWRDNTRAAAAEPCRRLQHSPQHADWSRGRPMPHADPPKSTAGCGCGPLGQSAARGYGKLTTAVTAATTAAVLVRPSAEAHMRLAADVTVGLSPVCW